MDLSIIIPFHNEEECVDWVLDEVQKIEPAAEIIAVIDGSTDKTLEKLKARTGIRVLSFEKNRGKGFAIYEGFQAATGNIVAMMDGDGQNDPRDIITLVTILKKEKADAVWGYRNNRKDSWHVKIVGKIGNTLRKIILGRDGVRDVGCALRVFKREHVKHLVCFEGLHRFMPVFFKAANLRIIELPVNHRARFAGKTKYRHLFRIQRGIIDLFKVRAMIRT